MFFYIHFLFLTASSGEDFRLSFDKDKTTRTGERPLTTIRGVSLVELFNLDRLNHHNPNRSYSIRLLNEDRVEINNTNFTNVQGVIVLRIHSITNYDVFHSYDVFHIHTDDLGRIIKFERNPQIKKLILIRVAIHKLKSSLRKLRFRELLARDLNLNEELRMSAIDLMNYYIGLRLIFRREGESPHRIIKSYVKPDIEILSGTNSLIGQSPFIFNFPKKVKSLKGFNSVRLFESNGVEVIFFFSDYQDLSLEDQDLKGGVYLNLNGHNLIQIDLDDFGRIKRIYRGERADDFSLQRILSLLEGSLEGIEHLASHLDLNSSDLEGEERERPLITIRGVSLIELFNLDRLHDNLNRSYSIRLLNEDRVEINDTNFTNVQGVIVLRFHSSINYGVVHSRDVFRIDTDDFGRVIKFELINELNHLDSYIGRSFFIKLAIHKLKESLREPKLGELFAKELNLNAEESRMSADDLISYYFFIEDRKLKSFWENLITDFKLNILIGLIGRSLLSFNTPPLDYKVINSSTVRLLKLSSPLLYSSLIRGYRVEVIFFFLEDYDLSLEDHDLRGEVYLNLNGRNIIQIDIDSFGRVKGIYRGEGADGSSFQREVLSLLERKRYLKGAEHLIPYLSLNSSDLN